VETDINTVIVVRNQAEEKTFIFPYIMHLQRDDLLDDREKPFMMRICFGTTDSKVAEFRKLFQAFKHFLDLRNGDTLIPSLRVYSGNTELKMRNVQVHHSTTANEEYIAFESNFSDAITGRIKDLWI
jgi:hypothetical protein